jgi:hypothetical protein
MREGIAALNCKLAPPDALHVFDGSPEGEMGCVLPILPDRLTLGMNEFHENAALRSACSSAVFRAENAVLLARASSTARPSVSSRAERQTAETVKNHKTPSARVLPALRSPIYAYNIRFAAFCE